MTQQNQVTVFGHFLCTRLNNNKCLRSIQRVSVAINMNLRGRSALSQNYLLVWIILIEIWGTTTSETLIMKIWGSCYDIQYDQQKLP